MKKIIGFAAGALIAGLVTPSLAQAQSAYTTTYVNLRAGPGFDYPVVATVPANAPLGSYGCLNDWSWCDVSFNGSRGWMDGEFVAYVQNNQWVPVYDYGPRYGVPIISFEFGSYWDSYYRGRPWYRDRDRWVRYDHDHHDDHHEPKHVAMPKSPPPHLTAAPVNNQGDHHDNNFKGGNDNRSGNNDRGGNDRGGNGGNDRGGNDKGGDDHGGGGQWQNGNQGKH